MPYEPKSPYELGKQHGQEIMLGFIRNGLKLAVERGEPNLRGINLPKDIVDLVEELMSQSYDRGLDSGMWQYGH